MSIVYGIDDNDFAKPLRVDDDGNLRVASAGGGLTVRDLSGSPSYPNVDTINLDQSSGLKLTDYGSGSVGIALMPYTRLLDCLLMFTSIVNTTNPVDLLSAVVPANSLFEIGRVFVVLEAYLFQNTGAARNITIGLSYGASTHNLTFSIRASAKPYWFRVSGAIIAANTGGDVRMILGASAGATFAPAVYSNYAQPMTVDKTATLTITLAYAATTYGLYPMVGFIAQTRKYQ